MKFNNKLQKTKHSKIKNTSLLFEFLTRQLTVEILNKKSNTALKIIKKRFNENTELGKELQLYSTLLKTNFNSDKKADYLISETLNQRSKLNNQNTTIEVYNYLGKFLDACQNKNSQYTQIDVSKLSSGIYIIKLKSEDFILQKEFIKLLCPWKQQHRQFMMFGIAEALLITQEQSLSNLLLLMFYLRTQNMLSRLSITSTNIERLKSLDLKFILDIKTGLPTFTP